MGRRPVKVSSLEISTMCYPTEDPSKVLSILATLSEAKPNEQRVSSHYGYSFKVLTVIEKSPKKAKEVLSKVISSMDEEEFEELINTLELHMDGRRLFIRIDKQEALLGKTRLYRNDPGGYVRIKVNFNTSNLEDVREFIKEIR